jgi:UPF0716 family protein affecting phage T7 exclusion
MTTDEFLWGGTLIGFVAALLVLVAGTVFGVVMGRAVEGPRRWD